MNSSRDGYFISIIKSSLNLILYWSPVIRTELTAIQPHLFLVFQLFFLFASPCLFIYSKSLIYKEAITCFKSNPDISLTFVNTILDYFPNDGASIQLKGEALFSLGRFDEAVQTWAKLLDSDNEAISHKASISISNCLGKEANLISIKKSKKEAILFYIKNLLKYNLDPLPNSKILKILEELSPESNSKDNPELQQHQAQLTFDSLLLECIRTY